MNMGEGRKKKRGTWEATQERLLMIENPPKADGG